ncbi:TolB family protein [Streptosporangium lutulentum]
MSGPSGLSLRARGVIAGSAAALLAVVAVGYAVSARPGPSAPTGSSVVADATARDGGPRIQVLSNGVLSSVSLQDPGGPRNLTSQRCDRAFAAGDTIGCLRPVNPLGATRLVVLDRALRERRSIPLTGFPNRLRVSASGRMVAWTLFIDGHSYSSSGGGFSTRAGILDTRTGTLTESVEGFAATVNGLAVPGGGHERVGVTFADDDNRFYATMSSGGHRYLIEGDFAARTFKTVTDGVECPSLSPDGTRIAFKAAVGGDPARGWRLSVLDLATRATVALAESRSVDDQAIWLNEHTVAYGLQRSDGTNDVWAVPADGTGGPRRLVSGANSPSVDDPGL